MLGRPLTPHVVSKLREEDLDLLLVDAVRLAALDRFDPVQRVDELAPAVRLAEESDHLAGRSLEYDGGLQEAAATGDFGRNGERARAAVFQERAAVLLGPALEQAVTRAGGRRREERVPARNAPGRGHDVERVG